MFAIEQPRQIQSSQPTQFMVWVNFQDFGSKGHAFSSRRLNEYFESCSVLISPVARRMNGFQRGKSSKSVISAHNRLADELITISFEICFENTSENHQLVLACVTIKTWGRSRHERLPVDKKLSMSMRFPQILQYLISGQGSLLFVNSKKRTSRKK